MNRVVLFGNSGSGKSTLARRLCASENLSHLDLDTLAWQSASAPARMTLQESREGILEFTRRHERWVIEGCYADLLEIALPLSTEVVFLDLPVEVCINHARSRPWEPHKYSSPEAQHANLPMLIDWIARYETREDTFSRAAHQHLFDSYPGRKTRYTGAVRDL